MNSYSLSSKLPQLSNFCRQTHEDFLALLSSTLINLYCASNCRAYSNLNDPLFEVLIYVASGPRDLYTSISDL